MRNFLFLVSSNVAVILLLMIFPQNLKAEGEDFYYTTNNGTLTITWYLGSNSDVIVPDTINGLRVTSVGDYAFSNNGRISNVTIPEGVTYIGFKAFQGSSLAKLRLPSTLTGIGIWALDCGSLTEITVDPQNSAYSSVDGVLLNKAQTSIFRFPIGRKDSHYDIPNAVTAIEWGAFQNGTSLTNIHFPASVTRIGQFAFQNCSSLSNPDFPEGLISIEWAAFQGCSSLTHIKIPNHVSDIGDAAFQGCTQLTEVVMPTSPIIIYSGFNSVFADCINLSSITIPEGVYHIGDWAFLNCRSLTNISLPTTIDHIGNRAFGGCSSLNTVKVINNGPDDGFTRFSIGWGAFAYCVSLTAVFIQGNAPWFPPYEQEVFDGVTSSGNTNATVYYLPGTGGWGANYGGLPTAVWKPQIETRGDSFGIRTNQFGFQIAWASGRTIAVEACTNTTHFVWESVQTNIVGSDGLCYYTDPSWTNHPARFYRVRWP